MSEYKKLPWWKKTLRAVTNMGQGILKLATNFIGYEDGEWNPKKCLKNIGIAVGCLALTCIPYVGPIIGYGLLASGVVAGAIGVGKGIYKATQAETVEELDNAFQDIGAGACIGISSAVGMRGLGKGFRVSNPSGSQFAGAPSVAKTRNGICGKAWESTSQVLKDMTVNSFKSIKDTAGMQKTALSIAKQTSSGHCKNMKAFGKVYKQNVSNILPKVGKKKFEEAKQSTINNIEKRINEIGPNPQDKILQQELKTLQDQLTELNSIKTKNQWAKVQKESKAHKELETLQNQLEKLYTDGVVKINERELSVTNVDDVKVLENLIANTKSVAKQVKSLSEVRIQSMRWMAMNSKKNKAELDAYVLGSRRTGVGYQWDINKGTLTWKTPFKSLWRLFNLPFEVWGYVSDTPAGSLYKIEQCLLPEYETNMFVDLFALCGLDLGASQTLTKEEYNQLVAQCKTTKKQLEEKNKSISAQIDKLS